MESIINAIKSRALIVDGALGTMLQARGLTGGESPAKWNITRPNDVLAVHEAYLASGCDVLTANTFYAKTREEYVSGVALAREAIKKSGRNVWLAADIGPCGQLLKPYGDMEFEQVVARAREAASWIAEAGADLCFIETMTDLLETKAAVLGAKEGCDLPVIASMAFEPMGRLLSGATVECAAAMLEGLRVDAIGMNCGYEPKKLMPTLRRLLVATRLPVLFMPNASLPRVEGGVTSFAVSPEDFATDIREALDAGAAMLGGCCGTTPEHIAHMARAVSGLALAKRELPESCLVSGRGEALTLGDAPVAIGERINPTGKPLLKAALRQGDMEYLKREAVAQIESGAQALDVNAGLPDIDESVMLKSAVEAIQLVTDAPLQIDTADAGALEAALRVYAGKPIINSVSGKRAVMDAVFPLAKKYGGAIVALTLDEDGIPPTKEGRVEIARRIISEAEKHGIHRRELIFDALTLSVSTDPSAARVTIDTMEVLRLELGVKTVLGVSNVSFGLPQRPLLTAAFVSMAVGRGLTAAILNPLDDTVMSAFLAAKAVSGLDDGFAGYIARYSGQRAEPAAASQAPDAREAIIRGLSGAAQAAARALMDAGGEPMDIVNSHILPALTEVGARFERGESFLPQLLGSAQAAQAAFDAVRERFPKKEGDSAGTVVIATVEGDVHDIGKNIVKVLLQNYGFDVIDLGKDVKPQKVLDAARESGARLVGLSALMTTTVPAMERTIALIKDNLPDVKVMVGGAVLTQSYADSIGADFYGADAMASVKYALNVYGV